MTYVHRIVTGSNCKQSAYGLYSVDAFVVKGVYLGKVETGLQERTLHCVLPVPFGIKPLGSGVLTTGQRPL